MKITEVTAVYPDYPDRPLAAWRQHLWQIVVRIEAGRDIVGYGLGGGGVASVEVVNRHFRELLVGRDLDDTSDIAQLWDDLYLASLPYGRKGLAIMALSGVDLALWDLLGHAEGAPVFELLGGARKKRVLAYATGPDTSWYRDLGFTAQKLSHRWTGDPAAYDELEQAVALVSEALGPAGRVMVDSYMSWDGAVAREMARRLSEYPVYFFEDLLTPDDLDEMAALRPDIAPVKVAGGEHEFTHHGFAEVARAGALDIWQPDITWCGGITPAVRILKLAEKAGAAVIPHRGGEIWGLQLIAASDCEDFAELVMGPANRPRDETRRMWLGAPEPQDGHLTVPDGPGFGVSLNPEFM